MRSPVTKVINVFNALTEDEKKLCLDFIAPEPEPTAPVKQTRKKRTPRAQSISAAITKTPKAEADSGDRCAYVYPEDGPVNAGLACREVATDAIHDKTFGYAGYHPFESTAKSAGKKSSRKGAVTNSIPSLETSSEGALGVGAGAIEIENLSS